MRRSLESGSAHEDEVNELEHPIPSVEKILEMRPDELVDFLSSLQDDSKLERFLQDVAKTPELLAQLSYWEKWLGKKNAQLLDELVGKQNEAYGEKRESIELPLGLEKRFEPNELQVIFENVQSIQLTFGCSKGCPFCGFDAIAGIREHIPYAELANMFKQYGKQLGVGKPFLYWASEPSDYASRVGMDDKTYEDVHALAVTYAGYNPQITSFNPLDRKWLEFMEKSKSDDSKEGNRLSLYGLSKRARDLAKDKLKTIQDIEILGDDNDPYDTNKHLTGMGLTATDQEHNDEKLRSGIACIDGVLLTPRGLYNTVVVPISKEYPQGTIMIPLQDIGKNVLEKGKNISHIMRHSVIDGRYSHRGTLKRNKDGVIDHHRYYGSFPKNVAVYDKNGTYIIAIDQKGKILDSEKPNTSPLYHLLRSIVEKKASNISLNNKTDFQNEELLRLLEERMDTFLKYLSPRELRLEKIFSCSYYLDEEVMCHFFFNTVDGEIVGRLNFDKRKY